MLRCRASFLDDMRAINWKSLHIANVNYHTDHGIEREVKAGKRESESEKIYGKTCEIRDPNLINGI